MTTLFASIDLNGSVIVLAGFAGLGVFAAVLHFVGLLDWAIQRLCRLFNRAVAGGFSWWRRWLSWAPWPVLLLIVAAIHILAWWDEPYQNLVMLLAGGVLLWIGVTACLAYVFIDIERYQVARGHKVLHNPAKGQEVADNLAHHGHRVGMPLLILATAAAISGFALFNEGLYYTVGESWYVIGASQRQLLDAATPEIGRAPSYTDFLAYSLINIFRIVDLVDAANTYNLVQLTYVHQMRWPAATLLMLFKAFFTMVLWQQLFTVVRRIFVLGETIEDIWSPHESIHERARAALGQFGLAAMAPLMHSLRQTEVLSVIQRQRLATLLATLGPPAIPLLAKRLTEPNANVRAVSVGALGHLHAVETLPHMEPLARDPVDAVRQSLAEALAVVCEPGSRHIRKRTLLRQEVSGYWGRLKDFVLQRHFDPVAEVVALLVQLSTDVSAEIRLQVVAALGKMGTSPGVILVLHTLLSDPEESIRAQAAQELGQAQTFAAPTLDALAKLLDDTSATVQLAAVRALGAAKSAAAPAVPRLVGMLQDRDDAVRREVAETLSQIGALPESATPSLLAGLASADNQVRAQTAEALGTIGSPADETIPALIAALGDNSDRVRYKAVEALGKLGAVAEAVPALRRALRDEDNRVSALVAQTIGNMASVSAAAVEDLRQALDHVNPNVRGEAATALGKIVALGVATAAREHCLAALQHLTQDPDASVRGRAVEALIQFPDVDGSAWLRQALADVDESVRCQAAAALGRGAELDAASAAALLDALDDSSDRVQAEAATALGKIAVPDEAMVAALCRLLTDVPLVQISAMQTLGKFGPLAQMASAPLMNVLQMGESHLREQALRTLGLIQSPQALEAFAAGLRDPEPGIRKFASAGLLKMPDQARDLVPALLEALSDPEPQIRSNVAQVLAQFEHLPEEAVPLLQCSATNPDDGLRLNVLRALKTQAGVAVLEKLLDDSNAQIQLEAAATLLSLDPQHAKAQEMLRLAMSDPAVGVRKTVLRLREAMGQQAGILLATQ